MPTATESKLTKHQTKTYGPKPIAGWGEGAKITAEVRFDDDCGNGHNTFSITAEIRRPGRRDIEAGGCLHDEIAKHFPKLAPFIKWHLTSAVGPMHYLANTVYLAGERDCHGRLAGEPSAWDKAVKFGDFPIEWQPRLCSGFMRWLETAQGHDFEVLRIDPRDRDIYGPKYTLGGAPGRWHECPFDTEDEGLQFLEAMKLGYQVISRPTAYSRGKERELDAARSAAVWPEATDEELTAPGLKERLEARLPGLMAEFRQDVESLGFTY